MLAVHLENGAVTMRDGAGAARVRRFALLRLLAGGICNTDLELQRGYYGFAGTPGHEFVAEVVEADTPDLVGQRVVGEINLACTHCEWCRRGLGRHCPNRTVLGIVKHPGAFQEFFTLPERNLHVAARTTSRPSARYFWSRWPPPARSSTRCRFPRGETVAVLGDGKLGLLIAMVLNAHGYRVHQFGRHAAKARDRRARGRRDRDRRRARCPSPNTIGWWTPPAVREGLRRRRRMTRPRGTRDPEIDGARHGRDRYRARSSSTRLTLVGSRCGRFEAALPLLSHPLVRVEEMIAGRFPWLKRRRPSPARRNEAC